jgi:hypothetical protein
MKLILRRSRRLGNSVDVALDLLAQKRGYNFKLL